MSAHAGLYTAAAATVAEVCLRCVDASAAALVQAELTRKRLERANKLTSGLSEEGVRWRATAEQLQQQIELLVGDVFISAACIAYYGAFTGAYR